MKKIINLLLISFMLLNLSGCSKQETPVKSLVFLAKDEINAGLVLRLDDNYRVIDETTVVYPYAVFADDNFAYISEDGKKYQRYNYQKNVVLESFIENINGKLLYYDEEAGYISSDNDAFCVYKKGLPEQCVSNYILDSYRNDNYLYCIDYSYSILVYDLTTLELIHTIKTDASNFACLCKIEDGVYLVNDSGVCKIEDDGTMSMTFVYTKHFDYLENAKNSHLYVYENDELVVYKMSFTTYQLVLELELDEKYYDEIEFRDKFSNYYEDGYYVVDFKEVNDD